MEINNILLPTDGSEGSRIAIEMALELAEKHDANLHALHVLEIFDAEEEKPSFTQPLVENAKKQGEKALMDVQEMAEQRGRKITTAQTRGYVPYQTILEHAEDREIDLIVMGTHGRTGLNRLFLGSTVERVLRQSSIPVVVVPMEPVE